ncbi:Maf family protein, partial [Akkermansiaceae bacterium]|nr:Maf family protein [Akkermansiaceae bacterium]
SDQVIEDYLETVPVLDKAGGYAIQDHGEWLVEEIEGDYHNIVGLPLTKVLAHLAKLGFDLPQNDT